MRTVGVQGDGRSYSYLAALSMQGSADEHWPALLGLAKRIPGSVHEVSAAPRPAALQPCNPAALPTRGRSPIRASSQLTCLLTCSLTSFLGQPGHLRAG